MATVALDQEADIQAVPVFRANTAAILTQVKKTGRPVVLTQRGRSAAVLVDVGSYQQVLDDLDTMREIIAGFGDARAGRVSSRALGARSGACRRRRAETMTAASDRPSASIRQQGR